MPRYTFVCHSPLHGPRDTSPPSITINVKTRLHADGIPGISSISKKDVRKLADWLAFHNVPDTQEISQVRE